jgi:hypothetical protein
MICEEESTRFPSIYRRKHPQLDVNFGMKIEGPIVFFFFSSVLRKLIKGTWMTIKVFPENTKELQLLATKLVIGEILVHAVNPSSFSIRTN